jgi:acetyl esterase/lipase
MTTTSPSDAEVGPPPPFDSELAMAYEAMRAVLSTPLDLEMLPALRENVRRMAIPPQEQLVRGGAFEVYDREVPGPRGAPDVTLLICRPTRVAGPTPLLYFIHGGGMVMGDRRIGVGNMLDLAEETGAAVASVEYRLAPENPHPAPIEDCYAGLAWLAANAGELGVDPGRVVVGGTSAGGGLSAGVALLARDRGGPEIAGQLLLSPMLDDRNDTPSARQMAGSGVWDRASNRLGWTALLGEACGGPDVSPYAAPARATDLSGLPPAFLDVGSAETFRDEVVAYASAIWRAGGRAELHVWPGGFHGFDQMVPDAAVSRAAKAARSNWLRRLLGD